jgi:hypothetical protein
MDDDDDDFVEEVMVTMMGYSCRCSVYLFALECRLYKSLRRRRRSLSRTLLYAQKE